MLVDQVSGVAGHRVIGVVVDFRAGHNGHPLVEQAGQAPDQTGLSLASLPEEDDVVAGEEGVLQLGYDRGVIAVDLREQPLPRADPGHQVSPQLFLDRDRLPPRRLEVPQGGRAGRARSAEQGSGHAGHPTDTG